jgi:hypothetical protein
MSIPISVSSGRGAPIASKNANVGPARPEASITRSAGRRSGGPEPFWAKMAATPRRSGEATISVARERGRISTLRSASRRCRQTVSSSGRDIENTSNPRSRTGYGSYPGRSQITSRPARIGTAPAFARSSPKPGNRCSSAFCPPASSACAWRACGVPVRGAGASGSVSRSRTTTRSTKGATAFAAASPPIPAPMTTACVPIVLVINIPE